MEPMNRGALELTAKMLKEVLMLKKQFKTKEAIKALKMAERRYNTAWKNNALCFGNYAKYHNEGNAILEIAKEIEAKGGNYWAGL